MRLFNVHSGKLEEFFESDRPEYAILSHMWGREELTFSDIHMIEKEDSINFDREEGLPDVDVRSIQALWDKFEILLSKKAAWGENLQHNPWVELKGPSAKLLKSFQSARPGTLPNVNALIEKLSEFVRADIAFEYNSIREEYIKLHIEEIQLQERYAKWPCSTLTVPGIAFPAIHDRSVREMNGYHKIRHACNQAIKDGYEYIWIDTCCIDKTSSAELSEAINSMFQWYRQASICYAYLEDVELDGFRMSRWFTRGWTLQELLAPSKVVFFGIGWTLLGTKHELAGSISEVTGIDIDSLLSSDQLGQKSIAQRMSWASKRETTRLEDMAYSLLGIFGVNLPLLYGEGERAFIRLQEEILRNSIDQSLFAWGLTQTPDRGGVGYGALAFSPKNFLPSHAVVSIQRKTSTSPYLITNKGLQIELPIIEIPDYVIGLLDCQFEQDIFTCIGLLLKRTHMSDVFVRVQSKNAGELRLHGKLFQQDSGGLLKVTPEQATRATLQTVFLQKNIYYAIIDRSSYQVNFASLQQEGFDIVNTRPSFDRENVTWNAQTSILQVVHDPQSKWQSDTSISFVFRHRHKQMGFAVYWDEPLATSSPESRLVAWFSPPSAVRNHKYFTNWGHLLSYGINSAGIPYARQPKIRLRHVDEYDNIKVFDISASLEMTDYFGQRVRVLSVSLTPSDDRIYIPGGGDWPDWPTHQPTSAIGIDPDMEEDEPQLPAWSSTFDNLTERARRKRLPENIGPEKYSTLEIVPQTDPYFSRHLSRSSTIFVTR